MGAGYFADKGFNVGLDLTFQFKAPVRVDETALLRWTITARAPKPSLKGDIVTLEGEALHPDG